MIGRLRDLTINRDGTQNITITVKSDFRQIFDELFGKDITIDIKRFFNRRSLDANAYCWLLIDKIAAKTNRKKTEVYLEEIKEIGGITFYVGVKDEIRDAYVAAWKRDHIGRDAWILPESGKEGWSTIKVRLGSSDFDSQQMSRLIDAVIQDAEALGIPTISDKEAEKKLGKWAIAKEKELKAC